MGPYSSTESKKMPSCKETKRYLPATVAWILLLATTSLFFVFPARWYFFEHSIWIPIGEGIITLIVIANFTLATFMDPGIIPKATRGEDDNDDLRAPLYKTVEVHGITVRMKWCVTCQFYRPPRCSHCSVCNHCIETFDHHCPWVNNCIGRRNYRFFFIFLLSLSMHMIAIFTLCLIYVLKHMDKQMSEIPTIISVSIMVLISILFIPIFGLTGFHIILVSRGRTTNEQVTGKYRGGYNPFSKGCCFNCWFTLCGPQFPALLEAKKNASTNVAVLYQPNQQNTALLQSNQSGNQVKVYVDNGNYTTKSKSGNSLHSPRQYRKMLPSNKDPPDIELGLKAASQSLDCEPPTPPMQHHGSKSNFFLPTSSHKDEQPSSECDELYQIRRIRGPYTHGSPHPNRQRRRRQSQNCATDSIGRTIISGDQENIEPQSSLDDGLSRSQTPDSMSPSPSDHDIGPTSTPTLHQKLRAIGGVPTPFAVSGSPLNPLTKVSSPSTPTQQGYLGLIRSPQSTGGVRPAYYESYNGVAGDRRRFLSEGELLYEKEREKEYQGMNLMNSTGRDSGGQIRELANSPQRGVYHWKDSSPTTMVPTNSYPNYFHSSPTSPIQHNMGNNPGQMNRVCVHHGVGPATFSPNNYSIPQQQPANHPSSPSMKKKMLLGGDSVGEMRPSPITRRPISFVKALEMTDSIEMTPRANNRNSPGPGTPTKVSSQIPVNDRASVYDMNYEISV